MRLADLAGLRVGDVLVFDSRADDDWILAGYRDMPEGFTARLPVQRADGSRTLLMLAPDRVPYLPGLNDVMALMADLVTASVVILLGVVLIWARPGLMTWSLFLAYFAAFPYYSWITYLLAFETGRTLEFWSIVGSLFLCSVVAILPFALCFPRNYIPGWTVWKQVLAVALRGRHRVARLAAACRAVRAGPAFVRERTHSTRAGCVRAGPAAGRAGARTDVPGDRRSDPGAAALGAARHGRGAGRRGRGHHLRPGAPPRVRCSQQRGVHRDPVADGALCRHPVSDCAWHGRAARARGGHPVRSESHGPVRDGVEPRARHPRGPALAARQDDRADASRGRYRGSRSRRPGPRAAPRDGGYQPPRRPRPLSQAARRRKASAADVGRAAPHESFPGHRRGTRDRAGARTRPGLRRGLLSTVDNGSAATPDVGGLD